MYCIPPQVTHRVRTDAKRGPTVVKMAADILSQFDATKLVRITIDCGGDGDHSSSSLSSSSRIDAITGRLAHSNFSYLKRAFIHSLLIHIF